MRSPRLGALGLRPADLLAAALGRRPLPRLAVGDFGSPAAADVILLTGGVLLTRQHALGRLEIGQPSGDRCAISIEACKSLADLRLLCADLVQYRRCCRRHGSPQWF